MLPVSAGNTSSMYRSLYFEAHYSPHIVSLGALITSPNISGNKSTLIQFRVVLRVIFEKTTPMWNTQIAHFALDISIPFPSRYSPFSLSSGGGERRELRDEGATTKISFENLLPSPSARAAVLRRASIRLLPAAGANPLLRGSFSPPRTPLRRRLLVSLALVRELSSFCFRGVGVGFGVRRDRNPNRSVFLPICEMLVADFVWYVQLVRLCVVPPFLDVLSSLKSSSLMQTPAAVSASRSGLLQILWLLNPLQSCGSRRLNIEGQWLWLSSFWFVAHSHSYWLVCA